MPTLDEVKSIHEAGHAVADLYYDLTFTEVLLDDAEHGPHVKGEKYRTPIDSRHPTAAEMDWIGRQAKAAYAAQWAEREAFGQDHHVGSAGDNGMVVQYSIDYVPDPAARTSWMSDKLFSAQADIKNLMGVVRAVARELIGRRRLTYDEVLQIYEQFSADESREDDP